MIAPLVTRRPTATTDVMLLGLYQGDDTGSTSNFLPVVSTLRPNPGNPRLPCYLFVGRPGYDRYDGRLLQGSGLVTQPFGNYVKLSLKACYIDSELSYFGHYADSYTNPTDPYVEGSNGRLIGLSTVSSRARLNVLSTDNNVQLRFNTGAAVEHTLLGGVDYSWNRVRKAIAGGYQVIDLYNIDDDAIRAPAVTGPSNRDTQKQLGVHVQDQIRLWDRVSVVLGARRDRVRGTSLNTATNSTTGTTDEATTFRAGVIGEVAANISPFSATPKVSSPLRAAPVPDPPFAPRPATNMKQA